MVEPNTIDIQRNAPLDPAEVEALRAAVGWDAAPSGYARVLERSYAHFSCRRHGQLVAFLNVVSDGVGDAYLVDVMVHPAHQRRGLGRALVRWAIADLSADGIQCIQVVFVPELEPFYRACGFAMLRAGIVDNAAPGRRRGTTGGSEG